MLRHTAILEAGCSSIAQKRNIGNPGLTERHQEDMRAGKERLYLFSLSLMQRTLLTTSSLTRKPAAHLLLPPPPPARPVISHRTLVILSFSCSISVQSGWESIKTTVLERGTHRPENTRRMLRGGGMNASPGRN